MKVAEKDLSDKSEISGKDILKAGLRHEPSANQPAFDCSEGFVKSGAARFGNALENHPKIIAIIQWSMVLVYFSLLFIPVWIAEPETGLTARLLFWGIGWPLIVLGMMLFGRFWCGIFCPDGTLTEFVSKYGKKRSIPRWIRWKGWPCTVLVGTTLYGQMTGFYEYFPATLVLLGIPTCLALFTGYLYGNGKRAWCMYLCPGNGFFGLLAKLSFFHFRVDREKWKNFTGTVKRINCAPLINIRQMTSTSACHACGRCSGYRNAVEFAARSPIQEIISANPRSITGSELFLLVWGITGICTMSLAWHTSRLYRWFIDWITAIGMPMHLNLPWWLADSPVSFYRLFFIVITGTLLGLFVYVFLRMAGKLAGDAILWRQLAYCLIPLIGWSIFLGLCRIGFSIWQEYGVSLAWATPFEAVILIQATAVSCWLGRKTVMQRVSPARFASLLLYCMPIALLDFLWTF